MINIYTDIRTENHLLRLCCAQAAFEESCVFIRFHGNGVRLSLSADAREAMKLYRFHLKMLCGRGLG